MIETLGIILLACLIAFGASQIDATPKAPQFNYVKDCVACHE